MHPVKLNNSYETYEDIIINKYDHLTVLSMKYENIYIFIENASY